MKYLFSLFLFLAVAISPSFGAVGLRQAISLRIPDSDVDCHEVGLPGVDETTVCSATPQQITISFAPTISGTTVGIFRLSYSIPCQDNLGQWWEFIRFEGLYFMGPPADGTSVGISSLTCYPASYTNYLEFYEVFGSDVRYHFGTTYESQTACQVAGVVAPGTFGLFFLVGGQGWSGPSDPGVPPPATMQSQNLTILSSAHQVFSYRDVRFPDFTYYEHDRSDFETLYASGGAEGLTVSASVSAGGAVSANGEWGRACIWLEFEDDHQDDEADLGCDCEDKAKVAEPINVKNGNTYVQEQDFAIPGLNGGLRLTRTWNSLWRSMQPGAVAGLFGDSWRSNLEERMVTGNGVAKYWRGDGSIWTFVFDPSQSAYKLQQPGNQRAVLTFDSASNHAVLTLSNGSKKLFSSAGAGHLLAEIDRNGNTTSFSYDASDRLATVTDPAGRKLYLHYTNPHFPLVVTSITSDAGKSVSYSYDSNARLIEVKYPDTSTLNFQYDQNAMLTTVTDAAGKILEAHTYDGRGRGLSSSKANGVEAVTISYPN